MLFAYQQGVKLDCEVVCYGAICVGWSVSVLSLEEYRGGCLV